MNYEKLTRKELIKELAVLKKQFSGTHGKTTTTPQDDMRDMKRVRPKRSGNPAPPAGQATERRYRIKDEDGNIRQFYEVVKDVHDDQGTAVYTEGALYEITDHSDRVGQSDSSEQTEIICRFRPDGNLTYVNEAYCRYFGCERQDLKDRNILLTISEQDREKVLSQLQNLKPDSPVGTTECRVRTSFGEVLWNQWSYRAIFDDEGHVLEYHSVGRDITYRKYTQEVLEKRAAILEAMITAAEGFLKTGSWSEKIGPVLETFGKATGASHVFLFENDLRGEEKISVRRRFEWFSPVISKVKARRQFLKNRDVATRFSLWVYMKSEGKPIYGTIGQFPDREVESLALEPSLSIAVVPITVGGRWWGFVGFADYLNEIVWADEEIALLEAAAGILSAAIERDERERKIHRQERFLSSVFDSIQDGIGVVDRELNIIHANPVMENWPVASRPLVGKKCYEAIYGRRDPCEDCPALKTLRTGKSQRQVRLARGPEGTLWMEIFTHPLRDVQNGPMTGVIEYVRDITEFVRAEDARKLTEERLQTFLNSTQDIVFLKDEKFRFSFANGAMCDLLGRRVDEIIGRHDADLYPEGMAEGIRAADLRALNSGTGVPVISGSKWGDRVLEGVKFPVNLGEGRVGIGGIFRDVTEKKKTEDALRMSEARYRELADTIPVGIYEANLDGFFTYANRTAFEMYGYGADDVSSGMHFLQVIVPEEHEIARQRAQGVREGNTLHYTEYTFLRKDGSRFAGMLSAKPLIRNGRLAGSTGVVTDISDLKKAQEALRKSEALLQGILQAAPIGIGMVHDRVVAWVNDHFTRMTGYAGDEAIGNSIRLLYPDEDEFMRADCKLSAAIREGKKSTVETTWRRKDGTVFDVYLSTNVIDSQDPSVGIVFTVYDITDQKKAANILRSAKEQLETQVAERTRDLDVTNMLLRVELEEHRKTEEALAEKERLYRAIVEDQTELICRFHPDGTLSFVNEAFCRYFGKNCEDLLGTRYRPPIPREDRELMTKSVKALTPERNVTQFEIRVHLADRGLRWVMWTTRAVYDESRRLVEHQAVGRDVTERVLSQQQIHESRNMLRSVFDGISDPLIMVGEGLTVIMLNRAALDFFDAGHYRELIGIPCLGHLIDRYGKDSAALVVGATREGEPSRFSLTVNQKSIRYEEVTVYPVPGVDTGKGLAILRVMDRTKQVIMERELIQNEKLASLGLLISGIVHEINNPNNFIAFNIPILREYLGEILPIVDEHAKKIPWYEVQGMPYDDFRVDVLKLLENMEHGSNRINVTVAKLKEFARKREDKGLRPVKSAEVVQKALSICHTQIRKTVKTFEVDIAPGLVTMTTDPEAIEQVLINLLVNAAQAADKEDSRIRLHVYRGDSWKNRLVMEVIDNGCGMDEATVSRIFEPFYTTKEEGCGTGLGLYISKNLIEAAGGSISVESEPGRGTTFRVIFPDLESREPESKKRDKGVEP
jgi:PAS domain S-box-containing protein